MKAKEIRELNAVELNNLLKENEELYNKLSFTHSLSPIENPARLRGIRKDIARLKTELHSRKLQAPQTQEATNEA